MDAVSTLNEAERLSRFLSGLEPSPFVKAVALLADLDEVPVLVDRVAGERNVVADFRDMMPAVKRLGPPNRTIQRA